MGSQGRHHYVRPRRKERVQRRQVEARGWADDDLLDDVEDDQDDDQGADNGEDHDRD